MKNQPVERIFPTYDNGKVDTDNNKKRFKEHFQVDPTLSSRQKTRATEYMNFDNFNAQRHPG